MPVDFSAETLCIAASEVVQNGRFLIAEVKSSFQKAECLRVKAVLDQVNRERQQQTSLRTSKCRVELRAGGGQR